MLRPARSCLLLRRTGTTEKHRLKIFLLFIAGLALAIKTRLVLFPILVLYILSGLAKLMIGLWDKTVRDELAQPKNKEAPIVKNVKNWK